MARLAGLVAVVATTVAAQDQELLPFVTTGRHFSIFGNPRFREVYAAGRNHHGQLGTGTGNTETPVPVVFPWSENETIANSTNGTVIAAAAGGAHSIFLTDDGQVWACGWNRYGQLGDPEGRTHISTPVKIIESGVRAVAAGYAHSLFLTDTGLKGVGWNAAGQLGQGDTVARMQLVDITFDYASLGCGPDCQIDSIAAGYDTSFVVTSNGHVWAFGNNLGGQLGLARPWNIEMVPTWVRNGTYAVAAGTAHTLFLGSERIESAGANFAGQLGNANTGAPSGPVVVSRSFTMASIFAGGDSSCIIGGTEQELFGFGSNANGQLGLGNISGFSTPAPIDAPEADEAPRFQMVALDSSHGQFLGELGAVFASGSNFFGQLGDATPSRNRLLQVVDLAVLTTPAPPVTSTTTTTTTTTISTSTTTTTTTTMTEEDPNIPSTSSEETTRNPNETPDPEPGLDQTTLYWLIGAGVTFFGLGIGCVAQGQAASRASEDDDDPEVELVSG